MDQLQPVAGDLAGVPTLPHYNIEDYSLFKLKNEIKQFILFYAAHTITRITVVLTIYMVSSFTQTTTIKLH